MAIKPIPLRVDAAPEPRLAYEPAGSIPHPNMVPFPKLHAAVRRWLWRHHLPSTRAAAPRGFLLSGEPGTGKTKSLTNALTALDHHVVTVPATSLADPYEAAHVERLEQLLGQTSQLAVETATLCILLVDDADSIFHNSARISRTSNHDLIRVWWQSLADRKSVHLNHDGTPILVAWTSNGMAAHGATFRDGRCLIHNHEPTPDERAAIIAHHLRPKTTWERTLVARLARRYRHMPLSFFAELAATLDNARFDAVLETTSDAAVIEAALLQPREIGCAVLTLAKEMAAERQAALATDTDGE